MKRALVYGCNAVVSRLIPLLDSMGIEIISCGNTIPAKYEPDWFDMVRGADFAVIDMDEEGAELIGSYISLCRVPVALLVNTYQADWEKLDYFDACGYIPYNAGETEFTCRLQKTIHSIIEQQLHTCVMNLEEAVP